MPRGAGGALLAGDAGGVAAARNAAGGGRAARMLIGPDALTVGAGAGFPPMRFGRAGQVPARDVGASGSARVAAAVAGRLWNADDGFARTDATAVQRVVPEDGARAFTIARCVHPHGGAPGGVRPRFVIALGLPAARGVDLAGRADRAGVPGVSAAGLPAALGGACGPRGGGERAGARGYGLWACGGLRGERTQNITSCFHPSNEV